MYFQHAQRILSDIEELERRVSSSRAAPKGLLRINAPLGFGRSYIGPAISTFSERYPDVDVELHLTTGRSACRTSRSMYRSGSASCPTHA